MKARETFQRLQREGRAPINLSIGEPELPPAPAFLRALESCASDGASTSASAPAHARYPQIAGTAELREAFAAFYAVRYGPRLDPEHEILPLIGAKEGIAHLVLAFADDAQPVFLPSVGYPVYESSARMAGAPTVSLGGAWEDGYRPTLQSVSSHGSGNDGLRGGLVIVGSPANPTGAIVDATTLDGLVSAARARAAVFCFDAAYVELRGTAPAVPLPIARCGIDGVVELHSLSKTFAIPGWRIAFAVGDRAVIAALKRIKSFVDSGVPGPMQDAVARALPMAVPAIDGARAAFIERHRRFREMAGAAVPDRLLELFPSDAGMFAWARVRGTSAKPRPSGELLAAALEAEGLVVVPGSAFGEAGADCVRMTVSVPPERLAEVGARLGRAIQRFA